MNLTILRCLMSRIIQYLSFVSGLFHLVRCPQSPSVLHTYQSLTPSEGCVDALRFVSLSMNSWAAATSWLQWETLCVLVHKCVPKPLLSVNPRVYPKERLLEKGMATHSSILASRTPRTEEPGRLHTVHGVAKSKTQLSDFQMWKFYEFFQEPSYCFLQQLYYFTLPQECTEVSISPYPHQHLLFLFVLIMTILMGRKWYLFVVLICVSMMISDVEHLVLCLLAT